MLLGREFTAEEDRHGGPPVVILSYALWHAAFIVTGKLSERRFV